MATGWAGCPPTPACRCTCTSLLRKLCWFCACRTQGVGNHAPVAAYVDTAAEEVALVAGSCRKGKVRKLHWGGGTPTILNPEENHPAGCPLRESFDLSDTEFSVEIDPTCIDPAGWTR